MFYLSKCLILVPLADMPSFSKLLLSLQYHSLFHYFSFITLGLQYVTDRVNKNCTVRPIHTNTFGATPNYAVPIENNSTWSLRMKTPQELFFIDDTYEFVGQVSQLCLY